MTTYYVVQLPNGTWIVRASMTAPMTPSFGPYFSRDQAQVKCDERNG